ncbi:MAG: transglycosylase SLT domain-containing protein [Acidimicrobiia bacterium]|nr:transglycosylase SLT domain-containing protein [Acidimicrobiia bacterium]NND14145.1 transglycosylase SLT domain-containing protein [Acidimicrobiia bacterium]
MRFTRVVSFATWVAIALLSVYAFAAFTPDATDSIIPDTTADPLEEAATAGSGAGRQAALALAQGFTGADIVVPDPTTTTVPPTTSTTSTTSTSTTTTVPPTTTTTAATVTTSAPAPAPRASAPLAPASVRSLVAQFFRPEDVDKAVVVAFCESRYDANATNSRSGAAGLFQHLPKFWENRSAKAGFGGSDIYDPTANVAVAAWLVYSNGGWKHWNASKGCWANTVLETTTTVPEESTTTTLPPESATTTTTTTVATAAGTTTTTTTAVPPTTSTTVAQTTTTEPTTTSSTTSTTVAPTTTAAPTTTVPATTTTTVAP